jgi:hypothetical protein
MVRSRPTVTNRWDRLLDQKPVPLREHLLAEVARMLGRELESWPLAVEELDLGTGRAFSNLLSGDAPRPTPAVFSEARRLARWDLERATDAIDDYFRNRRYADASIPDTERPALLLVSRWLVEQLLSLGEATGGRVKRADMVAVLDRIDRPERL